MNATGDWLHDRRPIRRVSALRDAAVADAETDGGEWPASIPAIAAVLRDGLDFGPGVTFLVGENGSGKSTLLEGIAMAAGLPPEGGSSNGSHTTRPTESPLADWLQIERGPGAPRGGFFLRAETMHGYYSYLESLDGSPDRHLHSLSHGESFNDLLDNKLNHPRYVTGLACLDEPEAALSFASTLNWMVGLRDMVERGSQVICATHSPVLAALPGARILELGDWGIREANWEGLQLVGHWRTFLDSPDRYLRHLFAD
ncbi:AAA family ATPase [Microterricola viridarii]|uniref:Predicted ATPase n=1 Tax=Microterricola viridarii TaxID=412690 RepID=A0A1H1TQI7_9MICO|nr:AAA family ATPase [Microterricola viridarii]SDS62196.1 Predicted ATPase [Microterricola viridarii]